MTFATRDHYRHVVERIATRTDRDEADVANQAIELARRASASGGAGEAVRAHVGYYLIDDGRTALEKKFAYRPNLRERLHRAILAHS